MSTDSNPSLLAEGIGLPGAAGDDTLIGAAGDDQLAFHIDTAAALNPIGLAHRFRVDGEIQARL